MKIVYITCKDEKESLKIGRILIEKRLAACINVIPKIKSIYRWEGKIVEDNESILLAKANSGKIKKLIGEVKNLHSYKVPCIEVTEVKDGNEEYLEWIDSELNSK